MTYKVSNNTTSSTWPNLFLFSPLFTLLQIPWLLIQHVRYVHLFIPSGFCSNVNKVSLSSPSKIDLCFHYPIYPFPAFFFQSISYYLIYYYLFFIASCPLKCKLNGVRDFCIFYSLLFPRLGTTNICWMDSWVPIRFLLKFSMLNIWYSTLYIVNTE